jgi:hypothetical protein
MLSRRQVMVGLPMAAAIHASAAQAMTRCTAADAQGTQRCTSGLEIGSVTTVRQRCVEWCWAACIQTIFSLHGREVEQEKAVERLFGSQVCRPATSSQIIGVINGEWTDRSGSRFRARAQSMRDAGLLSSTSNTASDITTGLFFNDGAKQVVAELDRGSPLIIGALRHATVLTAATYLKLPNDVVWLNRLVIRDPWPESANRRELMVSEVRGAFFVAKVWIDR